MSNAELIAEAREAVARINPGAVDLDALFQYRGGVWGRDSTLILRELVAALEAAELDTPAPEQPEGENSVLS
jgi:hypothetical protein